MMKLKVTNFGANRMIFNLEDHKFYEQKHMLRSEQYKPEEINEFQRITSIQGYLTCQTSKMDRNQMSMVLAVAA